MQYRVREVFKDVQHCVVVAVLPYKYTGVLKMKKAFVSSTKTFFPFKDFQSKVEKILFFLLNRCGDQKLFQIQAFL